MFEELSKPAEQPQKGSHPTVKKTYGNQSNKINCCAHKVFA